MNASPTPAELLDILVRENRSRRWSRQAIVGVVSAGATIMVGLIIFKWLVLKQPLDDWPSVMSFVAMIIGATAFSTQHRNALKSAQEMADPRFVGFFAEAIGTSTDKEIVGACEAGLLASLPLVRKASDIPDDQLSFLYKLISPSRSPRLVREVLETIRRVGGSEGVAPLEIYRDQMTKSKAVDARSLHDLTSMVLAELKLRTARSIIEAKSGESTPLEPESRISVDS